MSLNTFICGYCHLFTVGEGITLLILPVGADPEWRPYPMPLCTPACQENFIRDYVDGELIKMYRVVVG
jgi:hypothetical protein